MTPAPAHEHLREFAAAVIDVLTSESEQRALSAQGRDLARGYTFERSALALDGIISRHLKFQPVARVRSNARIEGDALSAYV
jgi:hypothetical protein